MIGRLHRLECGGNNEFEGFSVGENIEAKILKIQIGNVLIDINNHRIIDDKKTWIELTRRKEHMKVPGL